MATVSSVPLWELLIWETRWPVSGYKFYRTSTHRDQKQQRSMNQGLGAGGFSPPRLPNTNTASPRVPLRSLVFNTSTPTPSRRTLTDDLRSAEATRSTDTVKRARFAQNTEEQRLHMAHQRRTEGGLFLQHLDFTAAAAAEELRSLLELTLF